MKDIPEDSRCCIKHLWGRCQDPEKCEFGPHLDKPTEAIKMHRLYIIMQKEHGEPTGPKKTPSTGTGAGSAEHS